MRTSEKDQNSIPSIQGEAEVLRLETEASIKTLREGTSRKQLAKKAASVDGAIARLAPAVGELWDLRQKDDS